MVDGAMARQRGRPSRFGAFLDSTMDRVADGAVFASVVYWLGTQGRHWAAAAGLLCLVGGQIISYTKARAESLGMTANVGIAERAERLVIVGVGGLLTGLGVRYAIDVALWVLAALTVVTVVQRMVTVYRQDRPSGGTGPA
jgi:CDP-diacylglycerol--glycerol-3-phosphate 3-phosphatidyltransferase